MSRISDKNIVEFENFIMPYIVVLSTQKLNIHMRFSEHIMESNAQKQVAKSSLGFKLHDLENFELELYSYSLNLLQTSGWNKT